MPVSAEIVLPDFVAVISEVTSEVLHRVVRRTPRSALVKLHAQDQWEISTDGHTGQVWNDCPYIGYLENGTSRMPAVHMVAITMEEMPEIITKALKDHW